MLGGIFWKGTGRKLTSKEAGRVLALKAWKVKIKIPPKSSSIFSRGTHLLTVKWPAYCWTNPSGPQKPSWLGTFPYSTWCPQGEVLRLCLIFWLSYSMCAHVCPCSELYPCQFVWRAQKDIYAAIYGSHLWGVCWHWSRPLRVHGQSTALSRSSQSHSAGFASLCEGHGAPRWEYRTFILMSVQDLVQISPSSGLFCTLEVSVNLVFIHTLVKKK